MPVYKFKDEATGKVYTVEGDSPPTAADMAEIAAQQTTPGPRNEYNDPRGNNVLTRTFNVARQAMEGRPEFDLPSVEDAGFGDLLPSKDAAWRLSRALFSGNKKTMADAIQQTFPNATVREDARGYQYFTDPDIGSFYTERPGLDAEDVASGVGKGLAYTAAAMLSPGTAVPAIARAGTTAATEAATDVGIQTVGGDEIDPVRTTAVAATAGIAELGGPLVNRLVQAFRERRNMGAVRDLARAEGIELTQTQMRQIAREAAAGGEDVADVAARNEFGFVTTRGQRTGDFEQLADEERLRSTTGGRALRLADEANEAAIQREVNRQTAGSTGNQAAADAQQSFLASREAAEQRVNQAYDAARGFDLSVSAEAYRGLPNRLDRALTQNDVILDDSFTATNAARNIIRNAIDRADASNTTSVKINALESVRRQLNRKFGQAANPEDRRALTLLKGEYDRWYDDAVSDYLISGDAEALQALKEARGLRAEFARNFAQRGTGDDAGRVIEKLANPDLAPEEFANALIGAGTLAKPAAARIVKRYVDAGGDIEPIRQLVFYRMVTGRGGTKGQQYIANNLRESLSGKGESLMTALYSPDEIARMQRFVKALDQITPQGIASRTSGTTERLARMIDSIFRGWPVIGETATLRQAIQSRQALGFGERALTPRPAVGAAGAAAGSAAQ